MLNDDQVLEAIGELVPDDVAAPTKTSRPGKLFKFCRDVMGRTVKPAPHIEMLGHVDKELGDCSFTKGGRRQIFAGHPRGTYKTTCLCVDTALYVLERNPNARIAIFSHKQKMANDRLRQAKWEIEHNESFREKCGEDWRPETREDLWNSDSIVISKRTVGLKEPSIQAGGLEASFTGSHYDLIIVDDAVHEKNVSTADMREKVYDGLKTLLPLLEPNGIILHIFTRWHIDDAYGRMLREEEERIRHGEEPRYNVLIRGAYNDDGSLYFPAVLTHKELDKMRSEYGPYRFAANYLNKPIADEDRTFLETNNQISDFTYYSDTRAPHSGTIVDPYAGRIPVDITLAWDPAGIRATRRSNKHGITVVGCDPDNHWWVLEAEGLKGTPAEVISRVCSLIAHYRPRIVSCEDVQSQLLWLHLLDIELKRRKMHAQFHEFQTGGVPKSTRIELLQPMHSRGEIHIRPDQDALVKQLKEYSAQFKEDHFDVLDSLVQHLEIAQPASGDKQKTVFFDSSEDPEYEDYVKRFGNQQNRGYSAGFSATRWKV